MKSILNIIILLSLYLGVLKNINCSEVCYPGYGCYTDEYPFGRSPQRPISVLPQAPEVINTKFTLYNRKVTNGTIIKYQDLGGDYIVGLGFKFIIHGFLSERVESWITEMKDAFLENEDVNVITVYWVDGGGFPFQQAVANIQIVGVEIAQIVEELVVKRVIQDHRDIHLIGHSLGAHAAGFAGKRVKIGRITGLDPAGPYHEDTPKEVRLSPDDAYFVDVIHTNAMYYPTSIGFGINAPIGHVDFYPNGGRQQPGCAEANFELFEALAGAISTFDFSQSFKRSIGCSHGASFKYFTDSIKKSCQYNAYPCEKFEDFKKGLCLKCDQSNECNHMGYSVSPAIRGVFYSTTKSQEMKENYCKQDYQVKLISGDNGEGKAKGNIMLFFKTSAKEYSSTELIDPASTVFESLSEESFLMSSEKPVHSQITRAFLRYRRNLFSLDIFNFKAEWNFKRLVIFSGVYQTQVTLCPVDKIFGGSDFVEYEVC